MSEMKEIRCPNCGNLIRISESQGFAVCEYCYSKVTFTNEDDRIEVKILELVKICESKLSLKRYESLKKYAEEILKLKPGDFRGLYFKALSNINGDEKEFDLQLSNAVDACNYGDWIIRMHDEICGLAIDNIYDNRLLEEEVSSISIPHLRETGASFKRISNIDLSENDMEIKMLNRIKAKIGPALSLRECYILSELTEDVLTSAIISSVNGYDYIKATLVTSSDIMNEIFKSLPVYRSCDGRYTDREWTATKYDWLFICLLKEKFESKERSTDPRTLNKLRERKKDGADFRLFDYYIHIRDVSKYDLDDYIREKNDKNLEKMKHRMDAFIEHYFKV